MMTKIDFESMYTALTNELSGQQKKIPVYSALHVYYGLSNDGYYRIAFRSAVAAPKMKSTKMLRISQGEESPGTYWTCFDLLQRDANKVFFTFCENLIDSITNIATEEAALQTLKKRYITWKAMFKHESSGSISREKLQGLYGELYFMKHYMLEHYDPFVSVHAWSGSDNKSKDFAVANDWFEIKTPGANTVVVHISSLAQLSSPDIGRLVIIKTEAMSDQFDNGEACVGDLFQFIMARLNDETLEELFLNKLREYGFDMTDGSFSAKFNVKSMRFYVVDDSFPRLTETDLKHPEICDVSYALNINALDPYLEA